VAGLQIGAIDFDLGIADFSGRLLSKQTVPAASRTAPQYSRRACSTLEEMLSGHGRSAEPSPWALASACRGPWISRWHGCVAPIMPAWDQFPSATRSSSGSVRQRAVDNDVNVMALGEVSLGAARGCATDLVKIGTGMEPGSFAKAGSHRGSNGCAGDIATSVLTRTARSAVAGNRGCLEKIAAGPGIAERALAGARQGKSPLLLDRYERNGGALRGKTSGRPPRREMHLQSRSFAKVGGCGESWLHW